jgi:hypothetical protein
MRYSTDPKSTTGDNFNHADEMNQTTKIIVSVYFGRNRNCNLQNNYTRGSVATCSRYIANTSSNFLSSIFVSLY